ncbi:TP901 family phage tail tape measure protein [Escherichia coli]|uniref:TP901 family phage tail tape measure protein n=1 Tax=Escherichia coli TaxID=562 RepID=A0A2X1IYP7_ECOLX|nr:TP901 family phage tail tape measure protein [Escherichia coli]
MGTIQRVLEKVNALPQDKRLSAMTMLFGKEFGDDAAKLANNLPELQRQLKLTAGNDALGSMQKESDINKDSLFCAVVAGQNRSAEHLQQPGRNAAPAG